MSKIAKDTPEYILKMLFAVDYSKISNYQYTQWISVIQEHLGKHVKKRANPPELKEIPLPINQDFCDVVSSYDFNSLAKITQPTAIKIAKKWANKNLPLKYVIT